MLPDGSKSSIFARRTPRSCLNILFVTAIGPYPTSADALRPADHPCSSSSRNAAHPGNKQDSDQMQEIKGLPRRRPGSVKSADAYPSFEPKCSAGEIRLT